MSKPTVIFSGKESLDEILTLIPDQYQKQVMQRIFVKASSRFISDLRNQYTGSIRKAIGFVYGKSNLHPSLYAGIVHKGNNSWAYQRAYWRTFGTLSNRMEGHKFIKPRKNVTKMRENGSLKSRVGKKRTYSASWKGGIMPEAYVALAWDRHREAVLEYIEGNAAKVANDFLRKKAKK